MVIEAIFFHDFTFVPGDGFGRDFVQGGDFTDIKAMNNSAGDGNLRFCQHLVRAVAEDYRRVGPPCQNQTFALS